MTSVADISSPTFSMQLPPSETPTKSKTTNVAQGENRLNDIWLVACVCALALYVADVYFIRKFLGYLDPPRVSWNETIEMIRTRNLNLMWVCASASFAASGIRGFVSLGFCSAKQRPVLFCAIILAGCSAHCYWELAESQLPMVTNCFGRPVAAVRFALWHTICPFVLVRNMEI
jgi:hypothetical protein